MSYETELSNIIKPTNVISSAIAPYLTNPVVVAPLIYYESLPVGTNVKLWRIQGAYTAEEISESTAHAVDAAGQELTQTSVTATCVKLCANTTISVEIEKFLSINFNDIAKLLGEALARDWDDEILALFSGFTGNTVTASSIMTLSDLFSAAYLVRAGTAGVANGPLNGVFDFKAISELQKETLLSAAGNFSVPSEISILAGVSGTNGLVGEKGGVRLYQTSGLPTSGSDDVALVFAPELAFGGMVDSAPDVRMRWLGGSDGTRGYATEVSAIIFCDIIEWQDAGGVPVLSDT